MLKKLLDLKVILIVLLVLSWVAAGLLLYFTTQDNKAEVEGLKAEVVRLEGEVSSLGETVPAFAVVADVPSGKQLTESDIEQIDVPVGVSANFATSMEELIGKYCKIEMTAGTVFTTNSVYEEPINHDMRYYDVVVDVIPIGLKPGAFVDIRIKYGTGSDYLGILHRQVAEINGNTLKLILTEEDIQTYSSMFVENIVFNRRFVVNYDINADGVVDGKDAADPIGCYIYATEYIVGGMQSDTEHFYAPSKLIQGVLQNDPNVFNAKLSVEDRILYRNIVNNSLGRAGDFNDTAREIREQMKSAIMEGNVEYNKRAEAEAAAMGEVQ